MLKAPPMFDFAAPAPAPAPGTALAAPLPPVQPRQQSQDVAPRMVRRGPTGTTVFIHPCCVCGHPDAPFGTAVNLRDERLGTWHCRTCRPEAR